MSSMDILIGHLDKLPEGTELPEDTDDLLDLEDETGLIYVKVDGDVYVITSICDPDTYGFSYVFDHPPKDSKFIILYWYNGGGSVHEVAEAAIRNYLKNNG